MGALAGRSGRHRAGLAGAALLALLLLAPPAHAAREKVHWETSGGIAGLTGVTLTIDRDRAARAEAFGTQADFTVGERRWRQLGRRLKAARFGTLQRTYQPEFPVSDGMVDSVRYRGRIVTVATGAQPPERLARLIRLLTRIHAAHTGPR